MHPETLRGRDSLVETVLNGEVQIDDRIALFTDEVIVVGDIRIESVEGAAKRNSAYQALLYENPDVAIDRANA